MSDSEIDGESSQSMPNLKGSWKRLCHIHSDDEDDGDYEEAGFSKNRTWQAKTSGAEVPERRAAEDDLAEPSQFTQKRLRLIGRIDVRSDVCPDPPHSTVTEPAPSSHDANPSQPSSYGEGQTQTLSLAARLSMGTIVPKPTKDPQTRPKAIAKPPLSSSGGMLAPSTPASTSGHRPANPATGSKPSANSLTTEARSAQRMSPQSVAISASVPPQSVPVSPSIAAVKSISMPSASSASAPQSKSQAAPDLSPPAKSALHELQAVKADLDQPVPAPVIPVLASGQEAPAQERSTRFPPLSSRSAEFWCWDGNVIVKVEETYFRLFMSRLERYCGLFKRVFAERSWAMVTGQKVVEVPNLKVQDFETFLKYLEIPMENSVKDASKDTAMSLLRASRVVSCRVLAKLAEQRLLGLWASANIPSPEDELDGRPYGEAIEMLDLSRELNAPFAQKQALYSLLANEQFWSDIASQRAEVALSDTDILLLYRARATIQEKWRILALTPPGQPCLLDVCLRDESARNALWWGQTAKYTKAEVRDPLRSAVNAKTAIREMGHWCRACLEERVRAWDNARNLWWSDLDQLLGIAVPEGHV